MSIRGSLIAFQLNPHLLGAIRAHVNNPTVFQVNIHPTFFSGVQHLYRARRNRDFIV
jgi:hypothetical protein